MLINGFNLVHYLLGKGFIKYKDLFDKGISIEPVQSRNYSFKVTIPEITFLFVKQIDFPEPDKIETIKMEATCYWLAQHADNYKVLSTIFPAYIHFDPHHHILISEQIPGSEDLSSYFRHQGFYDPQIASTLAGILSSYHSGMFERIKAHNSQRLFRQAIPTPFTLFGEQLTLMKPRSEVERQMKELILSQPDFKINIEQIKQKWEVSSLIHGDIKFQNFLIRDQTKKEIKLIDWEVADLGDPLWDCAAILQSFILPWVMYQSQEEIPELYQEIEVALPAIHQFWDTYSAAHHLEEDQLEKMIQFCAIKLLHTCYESNIYAQSLSQSGVTLMQLSLNMLADPHRAIEDFFEFNLLSHAK